MKPAGTTQCWSSLTGRGFVALQRLCVVNPISKTFFPFHFLHPGEMKHTPATLATFQNQAFSKYSSILQNEPHQFEISLCSRLRLEPTEDKAGLSWKSSWTHMSWHLPAVVCRDNFAHCLCLFGVQPLLDLGMILAGSSLYASSGQVRATGSCLQLEVHLRLKEFRSNFPACQLRLQAAALIPFSGIHLP